MITCGRGANAGPATTPLERVPADYMARVRSVHESGGFGSTGCVPLGPAPPVLEDEPSAALHQPCMPGQVDGVKGRH